jgi:hypothetical protein
MPETKNTSAHLTEEVIQAIALGGENLEAEKIHLQNCPHCMSSVSSYRLLFIGIRDQPVPVFSFELDKLVLAQLPQPQPRVSSDKTITLFMVLAVFFTACIFYGLFSGHFQQFFPLIEPIKHLLIITAAVTICLFQVYEIIKQYRQKINILENYH